MGVMLMAPVTGSCATYSTAAAQKDEPTQVSKTARKMGKHLEKQGWQPMGGLPIAEALQQHYDLLAAEGRNAVNVEGHGEAKSLNAAIRMAQSNATIQYAQMMGTQVDGRALIDIMNQQGGDNASSTTKYDATYVTRVRQLVKDLRPSVSFYYQRKDGTYEVRGFYVGKGE